MNDKERQIEAAKKITKNLVLLLSKESVKAAQSKPESYHIMMLTAYEILNAVSINIIMAIEENEAKESVENLMQSHHSVLTILKGTLDEIVRKVEAGALLEQAVISTVGGAGIEMIRITKKRKV